MAAMAAACLVTVVVCYGLVRVMPTRGMALPFFWFGAYALSVLVSIPFVHVVYGVTEALGWRR